MISSPVEIKERQALMGKIWEFRDWRPCCNNAKVRATGFGPQAKINLRSYTEVSFLLAPEACQAQNLSNGLNNQMNRKTKPTPPHRPLYYGFPFHRIKKTENLFFTSTFTSFLIVFRFGFYWNGGVFCAAAWISISSTKRSTFLRTADETRWN